MDIPEFKLFSDNIDSDNMGDKALIEKKQPFVFEGIDLKIPKFVFFKDSKDFTIPFKINAAGLTDWLNGLSHGADDYYSCQQVFRAIRELNGTELQPQLRFSLLENIDTAVMPMVKHLEQSILEAKVPLTVTEQSYQELIVAIYSMLALGFSRVAQDICVQPQQDRPAQLLARALHSGLEALHRVMLHTCQAYARPYKGFWSSCYRLYRYAEYSNLLDVTIRRDNIDANPNLCNTIDCSFKNLLIFYLGGPYQCKPKSMKALFNALGSCASDTEIYKKIEAKGASRFFSLSLDRDMPPIRSTQYDENDAAMRYLETVKIAKMAYDTLNDEASLIRGLKLLKRPILLQLIKNLGMGLHRKFDRERVQKRYAGIIGYDNILRFLRNPAGGAKGYAIEPMDPRMRGDIKIPDLDIVPLVEDEYHTNYKGWQKVVDDRKGDDFIASPWMQEDDRSDEDLAQFEIVNSNAKGYGMLFKEQGGKIGIGEYIGICIDGDGKADKCEVGIIRRITQTERGVYSLGVELISSAAEAVCAYRAGNVLTKSWALLLRGIKAVQQPDGIIYNSHAFNLGDNICLERDHNIGYCKIKKLLLSTPELTHAELLVQR